MKNEINLKENVKKLPGDPGVYIMRNSSNEIIYIGKAKNLKNRVSSYFMSGANHSDKVKKMVENIHHFEYIVTDSEFEALVLECSLIKKHMPRYNILLKDDKGYSYIKITNETNWPRIQYVKQKVNDGAFYVGPYTNSASVKRVVEEVRKIFKIPTCNRNLDKKSKRPCLNYYIGRCSAPCIGAISHEKYISTVNEAAKFIKSGSAETLKYLTEKMNEASQKLDFEQAADIRDKIKAIENMKNRQKVVSYKIKEQDVIACARDKSVVSFEVFRFSGGDLCESQNFMVEPEDSIDSTRTEFLKQYYMLKDDIPRNIVLDGEIENPALIKEFLSQKTGKSVNISVPEKGEQLKLVEMCKNNAYEALIQSKEGKSRYEGVLEDLKAILSLKAVPRYIEAYDISNLHGTDNVGGMVVFENGKPLKSAYKRFKIATVIGQDDYSSIREMVERRFRSYFEKSGKNDKGFKTLPDMILIDGGIAHTRAAKDVLESFKVNVPVFGMVKDNRHKTRAVTTDGEEIEIRGNSRVFSFITSVQNEVHRYTIGYHKKLRDLKIKSSELTKIEGIGFTRAKALLKAFGSVERISSASAQELTLASTMTESAANSVYNYFHNK